MVPTLKRVFGSDKIVEGSLVTASEDFAFFARQVPGFFFFGVTVADTSPTTAAPNHSPRFRLDETGLIIGLRSVLHVAFDYLGGAAGN
jgi:amidohydrolase